MCERPRSSSVGPIQRTSRAKRRGSIDLAPACPRRQGEGRSSSVVRGDRRGSNDLDNSPTHTWKDGKERSSSPIARKSRPERRSSTEKKKKVRASSLGPISKKVKSKRRSSSNDDDGSVVSTRTNKSTKSKSPKRKSTTKRVSVSPTRPSSVREVDDDDADNASVISTRSTTRSTRRKTGPKPKLVPKRISPANPQSINPSANSCALGGDSFMQRIERAQATVPALRRLQVGREEEKKKELEPIIDNEPSTSGQVEEQKQKIELLTEKLRKTEMLLQSSEMQIENLLSSLRTQKFDYDSIVAKNDEHIDSLDEKLLEMEDLKSSLKFKDETIAHLMDQVQQLKDGKSSARPSSYHIPSTPGRQTLDASWHGLMSKFKG